MQQRLLALAIFLLAATGLRAQSAPMGSVSEAQRAASLAAAEKFGHPAEWVLSHRQDLNLRDDQVKSLEGLVLAQRDSETTRMNARRAAVIARSMDPQLRDNTELLSGWSGPVDEKRVLEALCEQSKMTAGFILASISDRHAVGAVLTEAQRGQLQRLQTQDMVAALRSEPSKP